MTCPRMSVVMPAYNVEAYIEEAIQSVLDQSFEDFELIVVDDGGSDNSRTLARSFDDPRIRIISQDNRGLAGARNTGIAYARAPYIALLDSDDRWHRDKLLLHYVHLQANPHIGVSYSGSRMIDEHGEAMAVAMRPKLSGVRASDILCRNPVGNGSAPVLRREALDRAAFRHPQEPTRICWFDESFRQSEDIELWVRLASVHGVSFEGIAGLLTEYRIIGGALSANVVKQYISWSRMLDIARTNAPELVAKFGDRARAYQLRYLARRSIQLGNADLADDLFGRATRLAPLIHWEEPLKSAMTWGAIKLALLAGPDRFQRLARPYLGAAA
ncbi:glycosyltransferase family A protein [Erythrobacter sp.]|uniref:glycosyltransferase family 2 protein n=1 Tax=Erythrobacter sp. TaxID=1042 RepID=UPI001B2DDDF1|nr:glycosyltransferase family A protein [Erythrobacter sp.]MBO6527395.1 glycosyltransferase family 2 protein [Erythrobacter sp.]MBO6530779.1 glycosyltransferase family 2 protein [Erythrobacter sp.]